MWLEEFLPSNKFEYFLDALSLLEIVTDNNKAFEDVMKMMELTHKRKWSSTTVAKYVASILLEIPTILGSSKCYDEDSPLPGIKTYESFNPSTLDGGVKGRIRKKLPAHGDGFRNTVGQMFYGSKNQRVKNLVLTMRAEAVDFWSGLVTFLDEFRNEMVLDYGVPPQEAWYLCTSCFRHMIDMMQKVRAVARDASAAEDPRLQCGSMIWAALSCLRVQRELLDAKFRSHLALAPIINLHLFRNRVNKEDVTALEAKLKDVDHRLKATQKELGTVHNKIAALEKRK